MPTVTIDGCELWYERSGEGPPLVLIPGFASGAWAWKYQLADLEKDFDTITFDPRGVARSANGGPAGTIEQIARDVVSLLDHLGIDRANVLGISFGGFVAQHFALEFPEKLLRRSEEHTSELQSH